MIYSEAGAIPPLSVGLGLQPFTGGVLDAFGAVTGILMRHPAQHADHGRGG